MKIWGAALALAAVTVTGCAADEPDPVPAPPLSSDVASPGADGADVPPAVAALASVPADATTLAVTDFDRVRLELGEPLLTGASPAAERADFWRRAVAEAPLLSPGRLRPADARLLRDYGFTQDDVAWEASFSGPSGEGWVAGLRDDLDLAGVRRAVADGVGPLAGAVLDEEARTVAVGAASDEGSSWAAEDGLADLVGGAPMATYVSRGCVPAADAGVEESALATLDLEELDAWSASFGGLLATVRVGPARGDVFARMRLAGAPFTQGVADPVSGRLGYETTDPAQAARLTASGRAPFAVCAP